MNSDLQQKLAAFVDHRIDGTLSDADHEQLQAMLIDSEEARRLFLDLTRQHAELQRMGDALVQDELNASRRQRFPQWRLGIAAALALMGLVWFFQSGPRSVATLASSEHAAWEGSLPTQPGAELAPGFLKLRSGVAMIRFHSGAEVTLEAPAHFVLESPMKGRLLEGVIVVDVPETAHGFVIETPDGHAVDHGTAFSVAVSDSEQSSTFEVLSGEISVHHPVTGEEVFMEEDSTLRVNEEGLQRIIHSGENGALPRRSSNVRIGTTGPEQTVIRSNLEEHLHPDFLMVKRGTFVEGFDRRSLFSFDLEGRKVQSAKLQLNLVPCGLGFAVRLPETSVFAVHGVPGKLEPGLTWETAPVPDEESLLGRFEVSRGQRTGAFGVEGERLVEFLNSTSPGPVTILVLRESDEAQGNGLVHAFASRQHPDASGPSLEFQFATP